MNRPSIIAASVLLSVFLVVYMMIQHSINSDTNQSIKLVTVRMDKLDMMINNLFGVKAAQEIRDAVRDMKAEHTHLDKKQTVIIIKLEKILDELMRRR